MKGQRRCSFVFLLLIWNWWMCFSTIAAQPPFGTLSTPTSSISAVPVTGTAYITQSARGSLLQKHCMLRASPDADVLSRWVVSDSLRTMDYIACQTPLSMDSPGKNTGVGGQFLLQGIFLIQGLNPCLLHWQVDSLPLHVPEVYKFTSLEAEGCTGLFLHNKCQGLASLETCTNVVFSTGVHVFVIFGQGAQQSGNA